MHKYSVIVQYSEEDEAFVATVPALPGCMTHGDTAADAMANAQDAIGLWLEGEANPPAPDTDRRYSGRLLLRLPEMLHRSLDQGAVREGTSLNQYVLNLLALAQGARSATEIAAAVRREPRKARVQAKARRVG